MMNPIYKEAALDILKLAAFALTFMVCGGLFVLGVML